MSGGFSGQVTVYGLPSGRLLKTIPVFSQNPENAYGYSEETKAMLNTTHGFVPWDDSHHPSLSMTDGVADGRWLFINGNNTPRVARVDLTEFATTEIVEIPNSAGNHGSPFITPNSEYVVASTRFSVPLPQKDVALPGEALADVMAQHGWADAVVKSAVSGGAYETRRVSIGRCWSLVVWGMDHPRSVIGEPRTKVFAPLRPTTARRRRADDQRPSITPRPPARGARRGR